MHAYRWLSVALLASVALLPTTAADPLAGDLSPITDADWNYERAAHLLERAGFGGTPEEIERLAGMVPEQAVASLLEYQDIPDPHVRPFRHAGIYDDPAETAIFYESFGGYLGHGFRTGSLGAARPLPRGHTRRWQPIVDRIYYGYHAETEEMRRVTYWWVDRMLHTARPLEERLTLFWHGHFGVSHRKVGRYELMLRHLETLREHASGNFGDLLKAVTVDPAMMVFLDNRKNTRSDTNENYAREIMELFALGVGNYTERDIKEAARALTGWTAAGLAVAFDPALHDDGEKSILGRAGRFGADDLVDILLEQPSTAAFIVRKLYRYFVNEDGNPTAEAGLANVFRDSGYEIRPLLEAMFLSRDFHSDAAYATKIKSPVDLVVGTGRKLELDRMPGVPFLPSVFRSLGQQPLYPPSVKGWDRGRSWVTPSTLFERANYARHLLFASEARDSYHPYRRLAARHRYAVERAAYLDRAPAAARSAGGGEGGMDPMMSTVSVAAVTQNYDLRVGVKNGWMDAWDRVPPIQASHAPVDAAGMLYRAEVRDAAGAVDYYVKRFLHAGVSTERRAELVRYAEGLLGGEPLDYGTEDLEQKCRRLLHAVMSLPEYQLS